jgi:hypothetical protein
MPGEPGLLSLVSARGMRALIFDVFASNNPLGSAEPSPHREERKEQST